MMHGNLLHATVQMGVLRLKVVILINHTVQWHILTHSESTLLSQLTARILDVNSVFQNTNVPIHEIFCVSTPPYYKDFFERSYPNVTLNQDGGIFCLQLMNGIQGIKPEAPQ